MFVPVPGFPISYAVVFFMFNVWGKRRLFIRLILVSLVTFFIIIMWINYTSPYMGIKLTTLVVIGTDCINITINFPSYFDTSLYTCLCTWKVNTFILKRVVMVAWLLDLQLPMQSVPITTTVVSLNPAQARCTWYNIMWSSLSVTFGRWIVFSRYSGSLHQ